MFAKRMWAAVSFATLAISPLLAAAQAVGWQVGQNNVAATNLPLATVYGIISNTLSWLLATLGFFAIIGFVISGIQYLTAAGDEGQAETAKNNMKYSIIGVIVGLMGYVAVFAINNWLNAAANF
ncbi:MAG: hypothetical protein WAT81_04710 [Candidatus Moraniibacteriota bacterium]